MCNRVEARERGLSFNDGNVDVWFDRSLSFASLPECLTCAELQLLGRRIDRAVDTLVRCIDGVLLGGTELPLILRQDSHHGIPFLDTTKIHVERAIDELLR